MLLPKRIRTCISHLFTTTMTVATRSIKLVILGESNVGKTALVENFMDMRRDTFFTTTVGVDFHNKKLVINNETVNVQAWDTAGQERFSALPSIIYKKADGFVLVYDITNLDSYYRLTAWIRNIDSFYENHKGMPIMLIGNKNDLVQVRAVFSDVAQSFADKNNMIFVETSAIFDRDTVHDAFLRIVTQIIQRRNETSDSASNTLSKGEKPKTKKYYC